MTEEKKEQITAKSFFMPDLGTLVEVHVPNDTCHNVKKPAIIAIVDKSGSMGGYVGLFLNGALPRTLLEVGYPKDTQVDVITFSDHAQLLKLEHQTPTIVSLQNSYCLSGGTTKMSGVFSYLHVLLQKYSERQVVVLALSDGLLDQDDIQPTIKQANFFHEQAGISPYVDVVMIRLKTSEASVPDTRALACLSMFNTVGDNPIYDVQGLDITEMEKWETDMVNICKPHFAPLPMATIRVKNKWMQRMCGDIPTNEIMIPKGKRTCFLLNVPNIEQKIINIDHQEVQLIPSTELPKDMCEWFCAYASAKIHVLKVSNKDTTLMRQWFEKMLKCIDQTVESEEGSCPNFRSRLRFLQRQTKKQVLTAVNSVLQSANEQKMHQLNQQQLADYLRQTTNKKLVKRTEKHIQNASVFSPTSFIQELRSLPFVEGSESSFYSMSSNQDILQEMEAMNCDWEDFSKIELVRIFGLVGVAYSSTVEDWIDPFRFEITHLFGKPFLSQQDLREANATKVNGVEMPLCTPGHTTPIQGVVPLRCLHAPFFDVMMSKGRSMMEMQSSINLRRMISPVRGDLLGERMAILSYIMRTTGIEAEMPQWQKMIFDDIRMQLRVIMEEPDNKEEFSKIVGFLHNGTILRDHLTGANNISCMQKVLLVLLQHPVPLEQLPSIFCALYEFDTYHTARKIYRHDENSRIQELKQMFCVHVEDVWNNDKSETIVDKIEILEAEEKKQQEEDHLFLERQIKQYAQEAANNITIQLESAFTYIKDHISWLPDRLVFNSYLRFAGGDTFEARELAKKGFCSDLHQLCSLVIALYCPNEQDRIKNGTCIWQYSQENVEHIIREFYCNYFMQQVHVELKKRKDRVLTGIVVRLAMLKDVDQFIFDLNQSPIQNRDHVGYQLLLNELQTNRSSSRSAEKCAILLSGHNEEGKAIWFQGNFDNKFTAVHYKDLFLSTWKRPDIWSRLVELRSHSTYQYRLSCKHNRHGNCNNPQNCGYCKENGCTGSCYWCQLRARQE